MLNSPNPIYPQRGDIQVMLTYDNVFSRNNLVVAFQKASAKDHFQQYDLDDIKAFTSNLSLELDRLTFELKCKTYKPSPVRLIQGKKDIALIPFRDRIVHECIQMELKTIVSDNAIKGNYGYLEGKSTYQAADFIHSQVKYNGISYFLATDIKTFFPSISHSLLVDKLSLVMDETVLDIFKELLSAPISRSGNEFEYTNRGIILGSPLSPTLSNLFLHDLDLTLETEYLMYVRYSDDLLLGSKSPFTDTDLDKVKNLFLKLELELNEEKTHLYSLNDHFVFLGFEFNFCEQTVNDKCESNGGLTICEHLEYLHLDMKSQSTIESVLRYLLYAACNKTISESSIDYTYCSSVLNTDSKCLFSLLCSISYPDEKVPECFPYDEVINLCVSDEKWDLAYLLQNISVKNSQNPYSAQSGTFQHIMPTKYLDLFSGQKNSFAKGYADVHGIRHYYKINYPLTNQDVQKMLEERQSLGIYPVLNDRNSCVFVIDLDIAKRFLLEHSGKDELISMMMSRVKTLAFNIKGCLEQEGINSYVLFSGYKGYHVWIFYESPMPVEEAWNYLNSCFHQVFIPDNIVLERIPSFEASTDEIIKLPLSWHEISHHQSVFLNDSGEVEKDQVSFIDSIRKNSFGKGLERSYNEPHLESCKSGLENQVVENLSPSINALLKNCNLISAIAARVKEIGYLTHYERNALLYVLAHMGDDGRKYLHNLMSFCINYQHDVTEGFISRIREKPVSCQKLMLRFPQYAASCSCEFKDCPHFYPSPVIYAYRIDPENVTRPDYIDREAREKEIRNVTDQARINILSEKLLSLTKAKNEIDQDMEICTKTVREIFDGLGISEIKTSVGLLMIKDGCWYIKVT